MKYLLILLMVPVNLVADTQCPGIRHKRIAPVVVTDQSTVHKILAYNPHQIKKKKHG